MRNGPTKPHVTALAMDCTPDIVTVSLTPNGAADQPRGPEKAQLSQGRDGCIRWFVRPRRANWRMTRLLGALPTPMRSQDTRPDLRLDGIS